MAGGTLFSAEDDARLKELWVKRATPVEISILPERSAASVSGRAKALGLKRWTNRRWTAEDDDQIRQLFLAFTNDEQIARLINRTYAATRKRIFDLGLKRDGRKMRLANRYGLEILADGKEPAVILAKLREAEEKHAEEVKAEAQAKISRLLDEMERGLNAGCDRAFMFTAALVGGATLQAIGDRVNLTRERVRQVIEKRAETETGAT